MKKKNHLNVCTLVEDGGDVGGHWPLWGCWVHQEEAHCLGNNGDGV